MSVESVLKKDGIVVVRKLDTLKVNSIAKQVALRLHQKFSHLGIHENDLFIKLSRLDMYIADMPEGMSEASYFYKNSSIYFNSHIDEDKLVDVAIHECIHAIQEVKDNHNYLLRMGLCDYTEFKTYGLALNEAAVQLMASKTLDQQLENVKYFNISFETISPSYYPLECCLVNQLAYITGENVLFDSTINSNDVFKSKLISLIGYKPFMTIQNSLDDISNMEEKIVLLNNKISQIDDRNKKVDNMIEKINDIKNTITIKFLRTQNLIVTSYFDREFEKAFTLGDLEEFRQNLYSFKDYLGSSEGYTFFNDYYVNKMMQIEDKVNLIENHGLDVQPSIYLIPKKVSKLSRILNFIKKLFGVNNTQIENNDIWG